MFLRTHYEYNLLMNIAFCVNRLALVGLGVTLTSVIRNCSNSNHLEIYILFTGLTGSDKKNILDLLDNESFKGRHHFIEFDAIAEFGHLRSLHGDWTAYGRILLSDLVAEDTILYLDADLVIELDVLTLERFDLKDAALAAVSGSTLKYALDHTFLHGILNIPLETNYFNSGILLLNLAAWRSRNIKKQLFDIAEKYPNDLISHDQTLLNALLGREFEKLPKSFNCPWYADITRPEISDHMILHYLGSPKPWDIGGSILHNGYKTWIKYMDKGWADIYYKVGIKEISRAWQIRKSYLRVIKKKMIK